MSATPTPRITRALSAGSAPTSLPSKREASERTSGEHRDEADARDRCREPEAERRNQREAEPDAVDRDRRQQDDQGRGARQQAGSDSDPEDALRGQPVVAVVLVIVAVVIMHVVVVVMVVAVAGVAVVVVVVRPASPPQALPQHRCSDDDDEQAGGEREPGIELVGDDELRQQQRHEPEGEHPCRVRDGHGCTEEEGMPRLPLRADEVAGDECLAVAGSQSVHRSPERRDQEGEQDHAEREVAALDQRFESAACVHRSRRCADHGSDRLRGAWPVAHGSRADIQR